MYIHTWIFVIIFIFDNVIAFLSMVLMTREGVKLDEERERNKELGELNIKLSAENARHKAKENIRVATEYFKQKEI